MSKTKEIIASLLSALSALLCIVIVVIMVCIMVSWTAAAVYILLESGCTFEAGRFVCELSK